MGGEGTDQLYGDEGADTLFVTEGETATGGAGADHFILNVDPATGDVPTVRDFTAGEDALEIRVAVTSA